MILDVNKIQEGDGASHGSRVPFTLLPFEHRSIKLLKQIKQTNTKRLIRKFVESMVICPRTNNKSIKFYFIYLI